MTRSIELDDLRRLASYLYAAVEAGRATQDDWRRWADRMVEAGVTPDWILGLSLAKSKDQAASLLDWAGPVDRDMVIGHKWNLYFNGQLGLQGFLLDAHAYTLEEELAIHSSVFKRGIERLEEGATEPEVARGIPGVSALAFEAEQHWSELFPPRVSMKLDDRENAYAFQDPPFRIEVLFRIYVDVDDPLDVEKHKSAILESVPKHWPFSRRREDEHITDASPTRIDRDTFLGSSYDSVSRRLVFVRGSIDMSGEGFAHAYCSPPYGPGATEQVVQEHFAEVLDKDLKLTGGTVIYAWPTDWASYFEAGHEWWGSFLWTLANPSENRIVVIMASATD